MNRKKPTKRRAKSKLRDLEDDFGAGGDDVEVNIRTFGVDLAENVDDVDHDDGVVLSWPEPCDVDACDEWALTGGDRCPYHYDGDTAAHDGANGDV